MKEYLTYQCRVCGRDLFVPVNGEIALNSASGATDLIELTCPDGHTDQYRVSAAQSTSSKGPGKLKLKQVGAAAG